MKTYLKPTSISIEIDLKELMAGSDGDMDKDKEGFDAKRHSFRIIDDSDDWSGEDNF